MSRRGVIVAAVGATVVALIAGSVALARVRSDPALEVPLGPAVVASLTPAPSGAVDDPDDDEDAAAVPVEPVDPADVDPDGDDADSDETEDADRSETDDGDDDGL